MAGHAGFAEAGSVDPRELTMSNDFMRLMGRIGQITFTSLSLIAAAGAAVLLVVAAVVS